MPLSTRRTARSLRDYSAQVRRAIRDADGGQVRGFGSTETGTDRPGSDVDRLFDLRRPLSLMQLPALETLLSDLIGAQVNLVPESSLLQASGG